MTPKVKTKEIRRQRFGITRMTIGTKSISKGISKSIKKGIESAVFCNRSGWLGLGLTVQGAVPGSSWETPDLPSP